MIRIAIVEDDTGYRSQLGKYIDQYQSDFSETVSVSEFSDGLEIVEKYKSEYDIILMDIQMKHMDGMQAAMRIRDIDKNVIIIFITNSAQFAVQGYKVEALDYVLKPIQYFAFSQVLHNAVKKVHGKYVLEAGDYKINLCSDSHTILDTYVAKVDKDVIYDDAHDGARSTDQVAATNQLTFAQGDVTYLSRADGFANYAEATAAPANHSLSAQALADYASAATFDAAKYDDPNAVMPTTGANNGLKLADLTGVAYDDPKWEQLLDELTVNDLFSLTADGGYHTVGVESIGLSATEDCDGPTGVHSNYNPAAGPSYPGTVMLACTWNQPLAKARGEQIAKECAEINCTGWYAPAMNIHRSAFGGRNFEYYSECGVLSGLTAAAEVSGATENGLICYVKHFAFNDQDNYRQNNICTWLNEQSAREIYLKAFEQPIKAGGMGVMTSMNAVGPVWAGGCKALLTNILRDEWGFHGAVITDAVVSAWYMDGNLAIRTGGTKMLAFNITNEFYRDLNSVGTVTAMRNAAHGTLYALANSFAVTRAVAVPKWVKTTYAVDAVVAIILVAWEICAIRKYRKAKKEDEDTEQ